MLKLSDIKDNIDKLMDAIADIVDAGISVKRVNSQHPQDVVYFCELPNSKFFLYLNKEFFTFDLFSGQHSVIKKNVISGKELVELMTEIGIKQTIITVGGSPVEPTPTPKPSPGFYGGDVFDRDLVIEIKKWKKFLLN